MARLFLTELFNVITAKLAALTAFVPKVIDHHDFSYYAENPDLLTAELPAIFLGVPGETKIEIGVVELTGDIVESKLGLRMLAVYEWAYGTGYMAQKVIHAQAMAEVFIGASGTPYRLMGAVTGVDHDQVLPVGLELDPPEQRDLVAAGLKVAAVAVSLEIEMRSTR